MPELPEVETIRRGISKKLPQQVIQQIIVRQYQLRWPIPKNISRESSGQKISSVSRRGKYLLIHLENGALIFHLGMSGRLRMTPVSKQPSKHDHVDIILQNQQCLRFTDPRRFGALLWAKEPLKHPLLKALGPEPLSQDLSEYLFKKSHRRKVSIKLFLMNSQIVVGIGNIYASEILFTAKISPKKTTEKLSIENFKKIDAAIKLVLNKAIRAGGTTLKDFYSADGDPGFFKQELFVYGREGLPCYTCKNTIKKIIQGQRSTFYCTNCQK